MAELERVIAEIRAERDTPAARRWCVEVWAVGLRLGEAEGLAWGRMVLDGCRRLNGHEAWLRSAVPGGAGDRA